MKHLFWMICCAALWLGLTTPLASAQEDEVVTRTQPVQEVFQTGLVYTQGRGEVQLSYTSHFSKGNNNSFLESPLNLEYGITDRWQIDIEWSAMSRHTKTGAATTRGSGDLSIGTQYSFMNMRRSNFHSAVGFEVSIPTGSIEKEMSEGFIEYRPYLIIARDFPGLNNMQIFSQVGVGFVQRVRRRAVVDEEAPAAHKFDFGVGMFVPVRHLVFTGEFNLSTNRWNHLGREREVYVTPGVVWRLPLNWEFGVGAPIGLTRDSNKLGAVVKVVHDFNVLLRSR